MPPPPPSSPTPTPTPAAAHASRRHWRRNTVAGAAILVLLVIGGVALWSWVALRYVYTAGQYTGYVRTLAKTGWLCKTWEGELVTSPTPAAPSAVFSFTIRDDSIATLLQNASGKQVTLSYVQHIGLPSRCLGKTEYFINDVKVAP